MKLPFMPSKRKLCQYGRRCRWKNERAVSNLGSRTRSVGFGSSSSKFGLLQDTASSVKKVLSSMGIVSPCLLKTLPSILIWLMPSSWSQIVKNQRSDWGLFSSLAQKTHRITSLTPASVWDLVRNARNQRFTFMSTKPSFQVRASSRRFWKCYATSFIWSCFAFYNGSPERVKELEGQLEGIDR